jgi:hypothetical protein
MPQRFPTTRLLAPGVQNSDQGDGIWVRIRAVPVDRRGGGLFALAASPAAEFAYADYDDFKVE